MIEDKSSFKYWYPKIYGRLPTPKSIIYNVTQDDINNILSKNAQETNRAFNGISNLLENNNIKYPIFIKTDHFSAKWYWGDTCFIRSKDNLINNIYNLLYYNECDEEIYHPISALIFREYIEPFALVYAFNDMPIGVERRYFIEGGKVLCHHPYWSVDDIEFFNTKPKDNTWKEALINCNNEPDDEVNLLSGYALKFGELIQDEGYFSVDFVFGANGKWYIIDAAEGHKSYHIETCPVFISKQ